MYKCNVLTDIITSYTITHLNIYIHHETQNVNFKLNNKLRLKDNKNISL